VDYLLLIHRHGCEELEGMCCINLSDHSFSIYKQINTLEE
ncbi:hypothetical protein N307_02078, partial [Dryobates pubescens]